MPTQALRLPPNSVWGFSIRRGLLTLSAAICVVWELAGCGASSQANATKAVVQANADIAFMGDSITSGWSLPRTNLGVPGDTTKRMLVRFPAEIVGHGFRAVVILGGTNDVRNTAGPLQMEVDAAIGNIGAMAEQAEKDNVLVVLCTLPPILDMNDRVLPMNAAIEALARKNHYKLVDYYAVMVGHPEDFRDHLHPSMIGYAAMGEALAKVLPLNY